MIVSFRHRFTFLATPKCASTAVEAALGPHADFQAGGNPRDKHMTLRRYVGEYRDWLEGLAGGRLETICLFREPVDWLASWWRYRRREGIPDPAKSTREMSFEAFVGHYLDHGTGPSRVGRQSRFVSGPDGRVGVDHIFRYDEIGTLCQWIAARTGAPLALPRLNVSPDAREAAELSPAMRRRLTEELGRDFEIYESLAPAGAERVRVPPALP